MSTIAQNVTYSIARNRIAAALGERNDVRAERLLESAHRTGQATDGGITITRDGKVLGKYTVTRDA